MRDRGGTSESAASSQPPRNLGVDLARCAQALAEQREKRIAAQDTELQDLRRQIEGLRIEVATLTERVAHVDELSGMVKRLQARQGRGAGGADKPKATRRRWTKPEG